jgi:hypothetical protein
MNDYKEIDNTPELMERLFKLPEFSRSIYEAIQDSMYAEPGFSDVTTDDLYAKAEELGGTKKSIGGAITCLTKAGLVHVYDDEVNGAKVSFLHTYEHDNEISRPKVETAEEPEPKVIKFKKVDPLEVPPAPKNVLTRSGTDYTITVPSMGVEVRLVECKGDDTQAVYAAEACLVKLEGTKDNLVIVRDAYGKISTL